VLAVCTLTYTKTHRDIQLKIRHIDLFRMEFLYICDCSCHSLRNNRRI